MRIFFLFITVCVLVSCKHASRNIHECDLKGTGQIKNFTLDEDVRYNAFYLYLFSDGNGREYLSFLNYRTNQILFYDFKSTQECFKMELRSEGADGVVQPSGFYIKDFDDIYISSYAYNGLIKVDTACRVIQKIPYGITHEGYKILSSYTPSSHPYNAPVFLDGKMYITQKYASRFASAKETPLTVAIDTLHKTCESLPLTYGFLTEEELNSPSFSRIYDGTQFVYSFCTSEDIFVASPDHSQVKRIKAKSDYITSASEKQEDNEKGPKQNLELARYGDLIYDPYREVYYRFAYPKVSLEDDINWRGKAVYGRKKFTVIVLDKDFRIVGETLFPEGIYNSYVFFVHRDGLYISRDYQLLYGRTEGQMSFELFKLVQNK